MSGRTNRQYVQYVGKCKHLRIGGVDEGCPCQRQSQSEYPTDASTALPPEYFTDDTFSTESDNSSPEQRPLPVFYDDTYTTEPVQPCPPSAVPAVVPPTSPTTSTDEATEEFDPTKYFAPVQQNGLRYVRMKTGKIAVYKWVPNNLGWAQAQSPPAPSQSVVKPILGVLGVAGAIGIAYLLMKKR